MGSSQELSSQEPAAEAEETAAEGEQRRASARALARQEAAAAAEVAAAAAEVARLEAMVEPEGGYPNVRLLMSYPPGWPYPAGVHPSLREACAPPSTSSGRQLAAAVAGERAAVVASRVHVPDLRLSNSYA